MRSRPRCKRNFAQSRGQRNSRSKSVAETTWCATCQSHACQGWISHIKHETSEWLALFCHLSILITSKEPIAPDWSSRVLVTCCPMFPSHASLNTASKCFKERIKFFRTCFRLQRNELKGCMLCMLCYTLIQLCNLKAVTLATDLPPLSWDGYRPHSEAVN